MALKYTAGLRSGAAEPAVNCVLAMACSNYQRQSNGHRSFSVEAGGATNSIWHERQT